MTASQESAAGYALDGDPRRLTVILAPHEEPETLEMLRMVLQADTRTELLAAAQRASINLLLSDPYGPALRLRERV